MDDEKFKKFLDIALRVVVTAILFYFVWDVIVKQLMYFS